MAPQGEHPLTFVLLDLGARLGAPGTELERRNRIEAQLADHELPAADVPPWLIDMLGAVRDGRMTEWTDFARSSKDDTNVFDFIRSLPALLPATYENNEESWLLTFPPVNIEACISLEGSCYRVSALGKTWD